MDEMKIALLGGSNVYAMNLARMALSQGHQVLGIGRSPLKGPAFTLGLERMAYEYHVYAVGPDTEFIVSLLAEYKPDLIVNYSAQGEGQASFDVRMWKYFYRTNTQFLVELTEQLHAKKIGGRFIQVGTSELYGSVESPSTESAALRPTSPYAISKLAFDLHLVSIAKSGNFPAVIIRPSNAFCPGQQLHRIIPKAIIYALTNRRVPLQGGGRARKSYLFADDLSRAILLLADKGAVGEVYNCGPEEPVSIRRVLDMVAQCLALGPGELYEEAPDRVGQDGCYWLDSSKLRALGWQPHTPLLGGIAYMVEWIRAYPELLEQSTDWRIRA
jgi:dTDP-glucose 4,6-dehydratase